MTDPADLAAYTSGVLRARAAYHDEREGEDMTEDRCRCIGVKDALHLAFKDQPTPTCPQHDQPGTAGEPTALNNDEALAAKLLGSLNAQENH